MEATTIIPNPSWGSTLQLFQERGHVFLIEVDADQFVAILNAAKIPYSVEKATKGQLELRKFILAV